jgi:hypothetical protein
VLVGGDDLDQAIMKYLTKYFGRGVVVGSDERPFPEEMLDHLKTWQTMPDLSRPQYLDRIKGFQRKSSDPQAMKALESLVTDNLGFQLFRVIEQCKRELSFNLEAPLVFEHGPIQINEMISRERFEQLIAGHLREVEAAVCQVVEEAGLKPEDIDVVLRTGGSSAVPAFVKLLERVFDTDRLRELEPLVSVVGGMAVIAQDNQRPVPDYSYRYERPGQRIFSKIGIVSEVKPQRYHFRIGQPAYVNDAFLINYMPAILSGMPAIRLPFVDVDNEFDDSLQCPARSRRRAPACRTCW